MNPSLVLLLWRIGGLLALLASLWGGYALWAGHEQAIGEKRATDACDARIGAQKTEAATVLAKAVDDARMARVALAALITKIGKDRETQQAKNAADLRARRDGPRLQFTAEDTGCRQGGTDTQSGAAKPADDAAPAIIQLPKQINDDLFEFAADAQSLSIDYKIVYDYVNNPKLVCELAP